MGLNQDDLVWGLIGVVLLIVGIIVWGIYFATMWRPL